LGVLRERERAERTRKGGRVKETKQRRGEGNEQRR